MTPVKRKQARVKAETISKARRDERLGLKQVKSKGKKNKRG